MNSFQFLSQSFKYKSNLIEVRSNLNYNKYLKKLIKLNGGNIKNINTKNFPYVFIRLPEKVKAKISEIVEEKIKDKLKKYTGVIITSIIAKYGVKSLIVKK